MNKRTFGKRTLAIFAAASLVLTMAASVLADAANPDNGVTVGQVGLTVTLSGTWTWNGHKCGADGLIDGDREVGFAVDWDEGFDGNDVPEAAPEFHPGSASDNAVSERTAGKFTCTNPGGDDATGAWGPISHTYAAPGSYNPCAIMYDMHYNSDGILKTDDNVAGGPDHNTDNSIEKNAFVKGGNCADVEIVVLQSAAPSAEQSVEAGTGTPAQSQADTALSAIGANPIPTILFSLILLASLSTLAYANVKTVRNRS